LFDKIEKNEMGIACGTCGGEERFMHGFWWGELSERNHLEDIDIDGRK